MNHSCSLTYTTIYLGSYLLRSKLEQTYLPSTQTDNSQIPEQRDKGHLPFFQEEEELVASGMRRKSKGGMGRPRLCTHNQFQIFVLSMTSCVTLPRYLTSTSLSAQQQNGNSKYLFLSRSEAVTSAQVLATVAKCFPGGWAVNSLQEQQLRTPTSPHICHLTVLVRQNLC